MKEINSNTPKSHLKLLKEFCEKKANYDLFTKEKNKTLSSKEHYLTKRKEFEKIGTLDTKTINELFDNTDALCTLTILNFDNLLLVSSNLNEIEKQVKDKGYDTEKIYSKYREHYQDFDELVEASENC